MTWRSRIIRALPEADIDVITEEAVRRDVVRCSARILRDPKSRGQFRSEALA